MMKRYAVFAGTMSWPSGGWNDFCGTMDLPLRDEGLKLAEEKRGGRDSFCWYHVVDLKTGEILFHGNTPEQCLPGGPFDD